MSKHYIIPIFVPHYGCPHDCVFCNQKKITGLSTTVTKQDVENIIKKHLSTFENPEEIEVAFYGGSFTAIDIEVQRELLSVPLRYKLSNKIDKIRLSTRPDAISREILNMLSEYRVDTIELGVQSLDDEVLHKSGRGHSVSDVYIACKLIKEHGINLGLQMMIGLPGDTREMSIYTCKEFIKLNPFCVRIYPTLVIKDTYLEKQFLNGEYSALSIKEAVDLSAILLMMFNSHDINVIRIGLQPTENIQMGKDVLGGPFHPAFRQLVEGEIYKKALDTYFSNTYVDKIDGEVIIEANKKDISCISGQKSSNILFLKEKYRFKSIKIFSKDIDRSQVIIKVDGIEGLIYINEFSRKFSDGV